MHTEIVVIFLDIQATSILIELLVFTHYCLEFLALLSMIVQADKPGMFTHGVQERENMSQYNKKKG